ncbi:hypothetical protein S40285_10413 [Stachybotrys chlorohalonatus IBT 40285]|uniref:DASH complex subunit DAD2 n=1 Tax=Stachybotrys chlorohalonatus (strain IBT 40285) TaxID=1283841 RepID=A0A084QEN6_STAC4|nr:hypothetical protein S40285_10413 [Stachybotrys chlorohalonata IBT 40285]
MPTDNSPSRRVLYARPQPPKEQKQMNKPVAKPGTNRISTGANVVNTNSVSTAGSQHDKNWFTTLPDQVADLQQQVAELRQTVEENPVNDEEADTIKLFSQILQSSISANENILAMSGSFTQNKVILG